MANSSHSLPSRLISLHSSISRTLLLINQLHHLVSPYTTTTTTTTTNQDISISPERHIQFQENARLNLSSEIRIRLHEDDELFELLRIEWELTRGVCSDGSAGGGAGDGGGNTAAAASKNPLDLVAAAAWRRRDVAAGRERNNKGQKEQEGHDHHDERYISDESSLPELITTIDKDLERARISFRKAEITAKRAVDSLRRHQRRFLLFRASSAAAAAAAAGDLTVSNAPPSQLSSSQVEQTQHQPHPTQSSTFPSTTPAKHNSQRHLTPSDILTTTSSDITSSLRRTHSLLTSSLSTSHFASETLAQSTAALESLSGSYADLDGILKSTKSVLRTLMQSQKSDTWYLLTSFRILLITIAWLVVRRFLWIGVCIGWWTIKMLFTGGKGGVEVYMSWAGVLRGSSSRSDGSEASSFSDVAGKRVAMDGVQSVQSVQGSIPSMSIPPFRDNAGHPQTGLEHGRAEALQYIDKIATEMRSGAGIQTDEARSEVQPGAALPVDDVPGDPKIHKDRPTNQVDEERDEEHDDDMFDETKLPPPEEDAHLPRNPKKRIMEEGEQDQTEYVQGVRDEL